MFDVATLRFKIYCSPMFMQRPWAGILGDVAMKEIWKDVKGHKGCYQISNFGRVKNLRRKCKTRWKNNRIEKEKILKQSSNGDLKRGERYPFVCLSKNGKARCIRVHKMVAIAFIPNPKGLPQINHKDLNKKNNCVENLEWVSAKENIKHFIENKER